MQRDLERRMSGSPPVNMNIVSQRQGQDPFPERNNLSWFLWELPPSSQGSPRGWQIRTFAGNKVLSKRLLLTESLAGIPSIQNYNNQLTSRAPADAPIRKPLNQDALVTEQGRGVSPSALQKS